MTLDRPRDEPPGLYCIELRTTNWDGLVAWYREVLGLRVLIRVIDDEYALLEARESRLAILGRELDDGPSRRISLAFEVRNMAAITERLQASGSRLTYPPRDAEGLREANTTDPDGNRIRLFCWPRDRG